MFLGTHVNEHKPTQKKPRGETAGRLEYNLVKVVQSGLEFRAVLMAFSSCSQALPSVFICMLTLVQVPWFV